MADPIRVTGLFSSFDTESVISQLTFARQGIVRKLEAESAMASAKKTTLAQVQTRFLALLTRATTVMGATSVSGKTASVLGTGVTAAASAASATGTFAVDVTKLATKTAATGGAISAAIDATSPIGSANFGVAPTNGTFTVKTASGGTASFSIGAAAADTVSTLATSNMATAATAGTYTIATATGGSQTFTIDPATQSLDTVLAAINASAIGVTATVSNDANGRANQISIVSTQGAITLGASGDTSNFITATNLSSATGTTTKTSSSAFTKQMSLNQVVAGINASAIGVTASIANDSNGRANLFTLNSTQGAITLGSAGDSSNFLTATNALASPGTTTRQSTIGMARLNVSAKMVVASWFGGAPAAGPQSFTVNGATINYDTSADSLTDVITRVNASAANVTARYDSITDTVRLESTKPGSLGITLADTGGGNLLSKLGLSTATQVLGDNAEYKIDGGPTQYASSNTVTLASGVTISMTALTEVGNPPKVTVTQDANAAVSGVKSFISSMNDVFAGIDAATKADKTNPGVMSGDASLRQLRSTLRSALSSSGINVNGTFTRLDQIGITFGAAGAAVGTTNSLLLDETKFRRVLASDPSSVQAVLSTFTLGATLQPGGTGSITGITGNYSGLVAGTYRISDNGAGLLNSVFTPRNGGPQVASSVSITASGTNTSLIPGMTLNIAAVFMGGTQTITVAASAKSPVQLIKELAETQAGAGGVMQKRQDTYSAVTEHLAERRTQTIDRIDKEMNVMRKKFMAMEQAQARYAGIASSLAGMMAQMSGVSSSR